jgi:hypothetical protein
LSKSASTFVDTLLTAIFHFSILVSSLQKVWRKLSPGTLIALFPTKAIPNVQDFHR